MLMLYDFNEFSMYLLRWKKGDTYACICMGTHFQPLLQNRLLDVYESWQGWSVVVFFGRIRPGSDPGADPGRG